MFEGAPGFAAGTQASHEKVSAMARLLLLFLLGAVSAGCTNYATSGAPVLPGEDPYFECRASAAYVRRHQDTCSAILR